MKMDGLELDNSKLAICALEFNNSRFNALELENSRFSTVELDNFTFSGVKLDNFTCSEVEFDSSRFRNFDDMIRVDCLIMSDEELRLFLEL